MEQGEGGTARLAILAIDALVPGRGKGRGGAVARALFKSCWADYLEPASAAHAGRVVGKTRDGRVVVFADAAEAVGCALAVQRTPQRGDPNQGDPPRPDFCIGLHLAPVEIVDGRGHGGGLQLAAQLKGQAGRGGILASATLVEELDARQRAVFARAGALPGGRRRTALPCYRLPADAVLPGGEAVVPQAGPLAPPAVPEPAVPEPTEPEPTVPEPTVPEPTEPEPTEPGPAAYPGWRREGAATTVPGERTPPRAGARHRPRRWRLVVSLLAGGLGLAAAGGGAAVLFWPSMNQVVPLRPERLALPLPQRPSLAVLPFRAGEGSGEAVADLLVLTGLTDEVRETVGRFSEILVIDGSSSDAYNDPSLPRHEIAEALGVGHLLEGTLSRDAERALVTVRLLDLLAGRSLWRERYERSLDELPLLRNEIARAVARSLIPEQEGVFAQRLDGPLPRSFRAWLLLLEARQRFQRVTRDDNLEARRLIAEALSADPQLAPAHALEAWSHYLDFRFRWADSISGSVAEAFAAADRAMTIDPLDTQANWLVGRLSLWTRQYANSAAAFRRALERSPNDATILRSWADTLIFMGEASEALTPAEQAIRLNPRHPPSFPATLAWARFLNDDPAGAVAALAGEAPLSGAQHQLLAAAYAKIGRRAQARAHVKAVLAERPNFRAGPYAEQLPFRRVADRKAWVDALVAAGFPP